MRLDRLDAELIALRQRLLAAHGPDDVEAAVAELSAGMVALRRLINITPAEIGFAQAQDAATQAALRGWRDAEKVAAQEKVGLESTPEAYFVLTARLFCTDGNCAGEKQVALVILCGTGAVAYHVCRKCARAYQTPRLRADELGRIVYDGLLIAPTLEQTTAIALMQKAAFAARQKAVALDVAAHHDVMTRYGSELLERVWRRGRKTLAPPEGGRA